MATTLAELQQLLRESYDADPEMTYDVRPDLERHPFSARPDSPVVAALVDAAADVVGRPPSTRGEPFWTDCALLADAGIDTVLFGVAGSGAHAASEGVDIGSLRQVTQTLTLLASRYCA